VVGILSATDQDGPTTFTFTFGTSSGVPVDGDGRFEIVGNELRVKAGAILDYEADDDHNVRIIAADPTGLKSSSNIGRFTILLTDVPNDPPVNYPPTNLALALASPNPVPEHAAVNTVIGTLSATDTDALTYTITINPNNALKIVGNQLQVADRNALEFSGWPGSVTVRATDTGSNYVEKLFTIALDENEAPTNLALAPASPVLPERSPVNTVVGTLSATDTDPGETLTYSLTDSAGGAFKIANNNQLQVANSAALEYDNGASRNVTVRVTDSLSQFVEAPFTITLTENSAPTGLTLTPASPTLAEHSAVNTVIGTLSATDPGDTLTYSLVVNPGNALKIVGNQLQVASASALEYSGWPSGNNVKIRVTDSAANSAEAEFRVALSEVLDELTIDRLDVQRGATQRSYIRYVDLYFTETGNVSDLLQSGRVQLRRYGLTGTGSGTSVSLSGRLSVVGDRLQMNFGSTGLATNGYYEISLDLDGDGTRETKQHFYRLLGDVNGDKTANATDRSLVSAAMGDTGTNLNEDMNGDGRVSWTDSYRIRYATGSLSSSLWPELDD
jgi:hypothetical protein